MTEYVEVTISGKFPVEDIELIANYYGGAAKDDKLKFCTEEAVRYLKDWLSRPALTRIDKALAAQKESMQGELDERLNEALVVDARQIELEGTQ